VTSFPTVLIIDPRTGEAVLTMTRLKDPVSFLEELMEFLERYPDFATYDQSFVQNLNRLDPSDDDIIIEEAAINGTKKVILILYVKQKDILPYFFSAWT
jgi:hypothetical protein